MGSWSRPEFRRGVTMVLGSVLVVAVAVAWTARPAPLAASSIADLAVDGQAACTLTPAQTLNSIKTFLKMMPVFRHPRCLNCHGGIPDPLPTRSRVNGVWVWAPAEMHSGVVTLDSTASNLTCEECHVDGWDRTGPNWADKTDLQMCRGMHIERPTAALFMDHIIRDGGGFAFIETAFKGKRGLTDGGQTIYETELNRAFRAEPPPGTHADLIQKARDWVAAQGGRFADDPDCGCVLDKLEIGFKSTLRIENDGPAHEVGTITGEGTAVLKLSLDVSEPDWAATSMPNGQTGTINWSSVSVTRTNGCVITIGASPATTFEYWLAINYQPELKFSLQVVPGTDMHAAQMRCPNPVTGAMIKVPGFDSVPAIFMPAWMALHGLASGASPMPVMPKPGAMPTAPPSVIDMKKLMSLDPKKLEEMAEAMKNNPNPASMAQIGKLMNEVVPGADKMADEARNNFKLAIPDGQWCKITTGTPHLAQCDISRTVKGPDGKGSTQTITEKTTITIGRPAPPKP